MTAPETIIACVRYVFDTFVIDAAKRELIATGTPLRVEPKVLDLILYLIERRDRVVSKDELVDAVWQGRFISDAAISSTVAAARRALGDDGREQRYLRTAHGRGFRFVGSLVEVGSRASMASEALAGGPRRRREGGGPSGAHSASCGQDPRGQQAGAAGGYAEAAGGRHHRADRGSHRLAAAHRARHPRRCAEEAARADCHLREGRENAGLPHRSLTAAPQGPSPPPTG